MKPDALLTSARHLLQRPDPHTAGIWPRASALLARQAIEAALDDFWKRRAPGVEQCSMRAQMLCLPSYLGDEDLAERTFYAWGGLSRACHHHAYELPPTASELAAWFDTVGRLIASVAPDEGGEPMAGVELRLSPRRAASILPP